MKKTVRHIAILLISSLLLSGNAMAQRISFGLYAAEGLTLTKLNDETLNFNSKQSLILAGQSVTISLADNNCYAALKITGRKDQDITVTVSSTVLTLNSTQIPLTIKFAYATNTQAATPEDAIGSAIEAPDNFTSVTFPFQRRDSGAPTPPTPAHNGRPSEQAFAYLYIYGTLGPVPTSPEVGSYTGTIDVHVEYSTY